MPAVLTLPSIVGSGLASYPGGAALVTDIDVGILSVGPGSHLFPTGPDFRVQQVGWVAVGSTLLLAGGPFIGPPTFDVWWWDWVWFAAEDKQLVGKLTFASDAFMWNLAPGCALTIYVNA